MRSWCLRRAQDMTGSFMDSLYGDGLSGGERGCGLTTDSNGMETITICGSSGKNSGSWIGGTLAIGGLGGFALGGAGGLWLGTAEAAHLSGAAALIAICETPYAMAMLGATVGLGLASVVVIAGVTYIAVTSGTH